MEHEGRGNLHTSVLKSVTNTLLLNSSESNTKYCGLLKIKVELPPPPTPPLPRLGILHPPSHNKGQCSYINWSKAGVCMHTVQSPRLNLASGCRRETLFEQHTGPIRHRGNLYGRLTGLLVYQDK